MNPAEKRLAEQLRALKLLAVAEQYGALASEAAQKQWSHVCRAQTALEIRHRNSQQLARSMNPELPDFDSDAEPTSPQEDFSLFSIGYGARTIEEFLTALKANRIEYLIDVRTSPYSKFKPDFTKELLQHHVEHAGLRYVFMGDTLGGQPRDPACHTDGKVDYDKVRAQPFFQAGLERLRKAFAQQRRVALMCSEGRPEECHRSKLIGEALAAAGIAIRHIAENGELLTQQEVIDRLTHGQMDLFGATPFTSRKRYGEVGEGADAEPPGVS